MKYRSVCHLVHSLLFFHFFRVALVDGRGRPQALDSHYPTSVTRPVWGYGVWRRHGYWSRSVVALLRLLGGKGP